MTKSADLMHLWLIAKAQEAQAVEARRAAEDDLIKLLKIDTTKYATKTEKVAEYECKITTRLSRKTDADMVQEIAAEHGLTEHLGSLFRWKPEIDMKAWKATSEEITKKLAPAITTTASRPSFSITIAKQE